MNQNALNPHIHLIGQGVISSLIATHALLTQRPFTQYVRTKRSAPTMHWLSGEQYELPEASVLTSMSANANSLSGIIIIPTKAYQISTALSDLQNCIADDAVLILMHNGLGTHETAQAMFPNHTIYAATTSMAGYAFTKSPHAQPCMQHTAWGQTQIGKIQDAQHTRTNYTRNHSVNGQRHSETTVRPQHTAQTYQTNITKYSSDDHILQYLREIIPELQHKIDILDALYTKLAVNAVINPLTAIHNVKNGRLADPEYLPPMQAITQEIVMLAKRKELNLSYTQIWNTVLSIVHATSDNYSSMHQDIMHGRRTEVDFINGFVVREAQKIGLNVPENEKLLKHIHILEERL